MLNVFVALNPNYMYISEGSTTPQITGLHCVKFRPWTILDSDEIQDKKYPISTVSGISVPHLSLFLGRGTSTG